MMVLYGGQDPSGQGSYSDLWHLRVHLDEQHIHFYEATYKASNEHYILSWRKHFSFEFLPGIQDPVIIGGNFGNNQRSQILMTVPETICMDPNDFAKGQCIPCPMGSELQSDGTCRFCDDEEYYQEDYDNYFMSKCKACPYGTIGGQGTECVPCAAGSYFDTIGMCVQCDATQVCPVGTRYPFPRSQFDEIFNQT